MTAKIEELRREIDIIDHNIVENLAKRRHIILEIAKIKRENNMQIFDPSREAALKEKIRRMAAENGLDEGFVLELYDAILKNSREEQKNANF